MGTDKNQTLFNLKVDFAKIRVIFENIRRLYTSYDYGIQHRGDPNVSDRVVRVLFIGEGFEQELRQAVRQVSFSDDESYWANSILQTKIFEDALVVFQSERPEAHVWKHTKKYLCVEFINLNGRLVLGDDKFVEYPGAEGYASKGFGCYRYLIFNEEHEWIKEMKDEGSWVFFHDCDENVCKVREFDLMEFTVNSDRKNQIEIPVEVGKLEHCMKCGESFLFDSIQPESLFQEYRERVLYE